MPVAAVPVDSETLQLLDLKQTMEQEPVQVVVWVDVLTWLKQEHPQWAAALERPGTASTASEDCQSVARGIAQAMRIPTDSQWARVSLLRAQLRLLPPGERAAALAALRAQGTEDSLVLSLVSFSFALPPEPDRLRTGEHIGHFLLGERLGAGGMGVVYLAQQQLLQTTRDVAVKLIHPALLLTAHDDALARFISEVQTLVALEYEGIARLYEAGMYPDPPTAASLPYLAMELVRDGQPITTFAAAHGLTTRQRLTLFRQVCTAVQRAHGRRILHRDLKPTNILVDSDGRPFVIDFGLAQAYDTVLPLGHQLVASGTPAYMSPEQVTEAFGPVTDRSDTYALGIILYELLTGQRPYPVPAEVAVDQLRQIIVESFPLRLSAYHAAYRGALEAIVEQALRKAPAERFSVQALGDRLDEYIESERYRARLQQHASIDEPVRGHGGAVPGPGSESPSAPYRGLAAFQIEHAPLFFGREALTERLLDHLRPRPGARETPRFLAIIGPSGSGKSSLARAGLLAALQHGALDDSAQWPLVVCRPGPDPLESLAVALAAHPVIRARLAAVGEVVSRLREDQRTVHLITRLALHDAPDTHRVLVLVDQFEEVFTVCRDDALRQALIATLLYAASVPGGQTVVVVTLRADFYGKCAAYPTLATALAEHQVLVGPLSPEELRRAIVRPAQSVGCAFESGLVELLLHDVTDQAGALPLLQDVLRELWELREGRHLTHAAYEAAGKLAGALEKRADTLYAAFTEAEQAMCRRVLLRLTQPGEGTEDTKRRVAMQELFAVEAEVEQVEAVVQRLTDARLITTEGATNRPEEGVVEVAHEALIRGWSQLRTWIDADREALQTHRRITVAAQAWQALQRDAGLLYRGVLLEQAKAWRLDHDDDLNQLEREFLLASMTLQVQEEEAKEAQRRRELEQARALAEAERQRAQEQARATQRLRRRAGALAVLFVLAVLGVVFAWRQQQQAERFAKEARAAAAAQATARREAQAAQQIAENEQARAKQAHTLALARQLAAQAELALATPPVHLVRSTLLATESLRRAPTLEGYRVWAKAMALLPRDVRRLEHQGQVQKLAFSPDGKQLATLANQGGTHEQAAGVAQLLNPTNGETRARIDHRGWVTAVAFSPDGRWLATASWDYTVAMSEVATGHEVYRLQHEAPVLSLAFSLDGTRLATATRDGLVHLWATALATPVVTLRHDGAVQAVAFSPDGRTLATASDDKTARLWNSATGEEIGRFPHPSQVMQVAYDPQGRWLATVHGDRQSWRATARGEEAKMRLWDVASGQLHLMLDHGDHAVREVVFTPDGTRVVTTSGDTVQVWEAVTGDSLARFKHDDFVQKLVLSRDGQWLATLQRSDKHVLVWDLATAQQQCRVTHDKDVRAAVFSRDGSQLATAGDDHTLRLWNTASCQAMSRVKHEGVIDGLIFSLDDQLLASSIRLSQSKFVRGEIDVWDPTTGERLQRIGDSPALLHGDHLQCGWSPPGNGQFRPDRDNMGYTLGARAGAP